MSTISWDDQRYFLAVFEEGSFSGAARKLQVAQPTVRVRIQALEEELGVVLFTRSINGLAATDQARALIDAAKAMARASDLFMRKASAPPGEIAGVVRISVPEMVGIEVMPQMLASLRKAHPKIIIELSLNNSMADLLNQEVDIAVRMTDPKQDALVAKSVGVIPVALFANADYLARKGEPKKHDDLLKHDFIGSDRSVQDAKFAALIHPKLTKASIVVRTDSHPAQLALARAGVGIAATHRAIGTADKRLRAVLPSLDVFKMPTWIVTHEDLRDVPKIRAVFDHLTNAFMKYTGKKT